MPGALRLRLFLSCWLVYVLHFATDFVREHYLVVSIVEDRSYGLDKYFGLHVDIFQNPREAKVQGAHHGANPGISMVAALPYFVLRPAVELVVRRELAARQARGDTSAVYRDDRPRRVEFYRQARRQGLDVRFGLVGAISTVFCMAPLAERDAREMIREVPAFGRLLGKLHRGSVAEDLLVPLLMRLSDLAVDLSHAVEEIDINPVILDPAAGMAVIVDALIVPLTKGIPGIAT